MFLCLRFVFTSGFLKRFFALIFSYVFSFTIYLSNRIFISTVFISIYPNFSLPVCLSLSLCLSQSICLSACLALFLPSYVSLTLSLCTSFSVSLFLSFSSSPCVCLSLYLSVVPVVLVVISVLAAASTKVTVTPATSITIIITIPIPCSLRIWLANRDRFANRIPNLVRENYIFQLLSVECVRKREERRSVLISQLRVAAALK